MATILLAGWRTGLQKVALANLQRELLHLPLKEAKDNVDQLLGTEENKLPNQPVVLNVPGEVAVKFVERASDLGVCVRFPAAKIREQDVSDFRTANSQQAA